MGFSTLIDLIGSTIIGGYVLLLLLRINSASTENSFTYQEELVLQQNLTSSAQIIEHDFRKIGYCKNITAIPDPSKAILEAQEHSIKFLTDSNMDGFVDTMRYYLGTTDELSHTANPNDKYLYRVVNRDSAMGASSGITEFRLVYMNVSNDTLHFPIVDPGEIASMEINLAVEKTDAFGDRSDTTKKFLYSGAFWRQIKLVARNMQNR